MKNRFHNAEGKSKFVDHLIQGSHEMRNNE